MYFDVRNLDEVSRIYTEIVAHIAKCGDRPVHWYAGVAKDSRARLFVQHNVSEQFGAWIIRTCSNDQTARTIEKKLLAYGCQGGSGGGDEQTTAVYAYRITSTTVQ